MVFFRLVIHVWQVDDRFHVERESHLISAEVRDPEFLQETVLPALFESSPEVRVNEAVGQLAMLSPHHYVVWIG